MKKLVFLTGLLASTLLLQAQVKVAVHQQQPGAVIPAEIYGQFSEHLGRFVGNW